MARFELWVDWEDDVVIDFSGWQEEVKINVRRFQEDDLYADAVSNYITRGLAYLTKEVGELDLAIPREEPNADNCE